MLPEILVSHVLLAMCGDRLVAIVEDEKGEPGSFLLGVTLGVGVEPEDLLRDLLQAADPVVMLLALCGWRTIAMEVWGPGTANAVVDRVELLASSFTRPAGSAGTDTMSWHVPVLRGESDRPLQAGAAWEVRLELTPQPLVDAAQILPLDGLTGLSRVDLNGDGSRVALILAWTVDASPFTADLMHQRLTTEPDCLAEQLSDLLADAAGRFADVAVRFEEIGATDPLPSPTGLLGSFAPARWSIDTPELAGMTPGLQDCLQRVAVWLSDSLLGPGVGKEERAMFFLDQARAVNGVYVGVAALETVFAGAESEFRELVLGGWQWARPLLAEIAREDDGSAWVSGIGGGILYFGAWIRLHDELVLDLVRPASGNLRADALDVLDAAAPEASLSYEQYQALMAYVRRFPNGDRADEAAYLLLYGVDFGGFWVTGLVGVLLELEKQVRVVIAASKLFPGSWEVIGLVGSDPAEVGEHDFVVLPHPDVAPLAQALSDWSDSAKFRVSARLSGKRRRALEEGLPGANVTEEHREELQLDYTDLATPGAVLTALDLPTDAGTGKGVLVGHPDTGLLSPIHSAIAVRARPPTDVVWASIPKKGPWPHHGTTTASAICGSGVYLGVDPTTGVEEPMIFRGVATEADFVPYHVGWSVALVAADLVSGLAGGSGTVGALATAIRYFTTLPNAERPNVLSISLGYKFDVFVGASVGISTLVVAVTRFSPMAIGLAALLAALNDLRNACHAAYEAGIILCAAAGQVLKWTGWIGGPTYPAAFPTVVGCAGLRGNGEPWSYSFRGAEVNVAVPCVGAWGARWKGDDIETDDERVMQSEGTSYATALTAGVAALWFEKYRDALVGQNPAKVFLEKVLPNCRLDPILDGDGNELKRWGGRLSAAKILEYDWVGAP